MVMNEFQSTLATALQSEADRTTLGLDTADAAHRLETGMDRIDRDRRHRTWATALTAAAALLVAGAVYGVTMIDSPTAHEPAGPPHTNAPKAYQDSSGAPIDPGTYRMWVGLTGNGLAIDADLTLDGGGWKSQHDPVRRDTNGHYGAVAVYQPTALAAGTGCLGDTPNRHVSQSPAKLAQQLAQLPRSSVVQSPTPERAFGRDVVHLRLRIKDDCRDEYRLAETMTGDHSISYGKTPHKVDIDFWVTEVGGYPVVVDTWHTAGASRPLVDQIARTWQSIKFVTGDVSR
jgi:hypothetical protein